MTFCSHFKRLRSHEVWSFKNFKSSNRFESVRKEAFQLLSFRASEALTCSKLCRNQTVNLLQGFHFLLKFGLLIDSFKFLLCFFRYLFSFTFSSPISNECADSPTLPPRLSGKSNVFTLENMGSIPALTGNLNQTKLAPNWRCRL